MKDAWGLPAMRVTFEYHPDDVATMKWLLTKQMEILEAAGAQKVWHGLWRSKTTCRRVT